MKIQSHFGYKVRYRALSKTDLFLPWGGPREILRDPVWFESPNLKLPIMTRMRQEVYGVKH